MIIESVRNVLGTNDGSLPDINFDFGASRVVGDAYALLQSRASCLASEGAYYWSRNKGEERPIRFGENPALAFLDGDAEGFHVVFSGVRSSTGAPIPDLGVSVLDVGFIALDYRMGPAWDEAAILGLFEIMRELEAISSSVDISHTGNIFESEQGVLLSEFGRWKAVSSGAPRQA
jgi:hypothetical protein